MHTTIVKRETACWGDVQHCGGLVSLESGTVWHRSNRDPETEHIRMATLSVEQLPQSRYDLPTFKVMARDERIYRAGKYRGAVEVTWFESGTFDRLCDAQLFADWAIERWHAADTFCASGMDLRLDIDPSGNPGT